MTFYNEPKIEFAYVAKRAKDFNLLVAQQAEILYRQRGMIFPVYVSSTLELIGRMEPVSQADLRVELDQPHQLIAHRLKELEKIELISRITDPKDKRRSLISLSPLGKVQFAILQNFTSEASSVFGKLFDELEVNLSHVLGEAISSIKRTPLDQRFASADKYHSRVNK